MDRLIRTLETMVSEGQRPRAKTILELAYSERDRMGKQAERASANGGASDETMERLLLDGVVPDLVGTAEAAKILGIGRAQIGKWLNPPSGEPRMPLPLLRIAAGPLWPRQVILGFKAEVKSRRRTRAA